MTLPARGSHDLPQCRSLTGLEHGYDPLPLAGFAMQFDALGRLGRLQALDGFPDPCNGCFPVRKTLHRNHARETVPNIDQLRRRPGLAEVTEFGSSVPLCRLRRMVKQWFTTQTVPCLERTRTQSGHD